MTRPRYRAIVDAFLERARWAARHAHDDRALWHLYADMIDIMARHGADVSALQNPYQHPPRPTGAKRFTA